MNEALYKPNQLWLHRLYVGFMILMLISYQLICHLFAEDIQINLSEETRTLIRSIFYAVTIILFPLVNLVRHILLRLNQTMPIEEHSSAMSRYLLTTVVTLSLIEAVGLMGLIMFVLGDAYHTLYIFSCLAILGLFLHRPRKTEFLSIVNSMSDVNSQEDKER